MSEAVLERAAALLGEGRVVAFTGAGISAEAGIPTFRDPGGLWDRFDPSAFGTWEGLAQTALTEPDALASFLAELRAVIAQARPTRAHAALASLEERGVVEGVITQNVDGLHQEAGSRRVIELHGSFGRQVCLACGRRHSVERAVFLEQLDRAIVAFRSAFVPSLVAVLPRCDWCGGPARPDFVAFGEAVEGYQEAQARVRRCRLLLVVGTSGEVFPAAALPEEARAAGASILEVTAGMTSIRADLRIEGTAGAVLPFLSEVSSPRSR